jgi:c-di-GMP-binding flagellar brake protein YcgR
MIEKRKTIRKPLIVTTVIRKTTHGGGSGDYEILEFRTHDVSEGGIFISTEDLSLFDLGEELEIMVEDEDERFYEGRARVVRSAKVFTEEGSRIESGFGLMFLFPDRELSGMLSRNLKE